MLHAIELENFKAFGNRVHIPCAPITLIFGQNSAGKSSILQSLNLLKQTRENKDSGAVLLPRADNGITDLGSFQDLLFNHDLKRSLMIRLLVSFSDKRHSNYFQKAMRLFEPGPLIAGMELAFNRKSIKEEVRLKELDFFLGNKEKPFSKLKYTEANKRDILDMTRLRPLSMNFSKNLNMAKVAWLNNNSNYWDGGFRLFKEKRKELLGNLKKLQESLSKQENNINQRRLFDLDDESNFSKSQMQKDIDKAIQFYSTDFSIDDFSERMTDIFKNILVGLEGFIPVLQGRHSKFIPEMEAMRYVSSRNFSPFLRPDPARFILLISSEIDDSLNRLFPLGPFRRPPERWYIFTGTSPQDVGYQGNSLPDLLYRNPSLVRNTNNWLKKLEIGYKLSIRSVGRRSKDLFEVRLVDTNRESKIDVCLADVGFGISQLLPFIVQSLASQDQIISIEQPEIHVHPKLQADLGDLMAEAIQEPRNNQFIIETHSEHLILRLLRRIRETAEGELPKGVSPLRPDQLSIVYVQRGENGSEVIHIPVNKEGEFERQWPQGFFSERAKELF